jgi:CRISPR-associated exonuclease Cas4
MSGLQNLDDNLISISSLSSFVFCKRRHYLLNVECNDTYYGNELTALGKAEHENVHASKIEKRGSFVKVHNMQVYSEKLSLIGKCDTVEFYKNSTGPYISFLDGNYDFVIVEHKRKELDFNDCDIIQITAQTMCLEEMFNTKITQAYIYYSQTNKKVPFEITDTNRSKVKKLVGEIYETEQLKKVPPAKFLKSCKNCAAYDICNPKEYNVKKYIDYVWRQL